MLKILQGDEIQIYLQRKQRQEAYDPEVVKKVEKILENVKLQGLNALYHYTYQFDGCNLREIGIQVKEEEQKEAYVKVDPDFQRALEKIIPRLRTFHRKGRPASYSFKNDGEEIGTLYQPIQRVGIYIPGGRAPYPSTILMTVIPAQEAGVSEIILATPPDGEGKINPYLLYTANLLQVHQILRVGGAQAIGALAYGLEGFEPVHKIFGPGNIYVTLAKKLLYGHVGIDMLAGPSEIVIIAQEGAPPSFIASDLLAQAEHDPLALPILISPCKKLLQRVSSLLEEMVEGEPRKEIVRVSLSKQGRAFLVTSIEEGLHISNVIAPEHLVLMVEGAEKYISLVKNAGALFLGAYTPQAIGDYLAGPSHVIPTGGTSRFSSPLGVEDFMKRTSLMAFSKRKIEELTEEGALMARLEGLYAHERSLKIREEDFFHE